MKKCGKVPNPILVLHLKRKYYDLIASGDKVIEYRDMTSYWLQRITPEKKIVHFYCGYPPKGTPPLVRDITGITMNAATEQIEIHLGIPQNF